MEKDTSLTREEVFKKIGFKHVTKGNKSGSLIILAPINQNQIKISLTRGFFKFQK